MKRVIEPFAVEYKRRPKRGKTAETSIWSSSLGDEIKTLMRADAEPEQPSAKTDRKGPAAALFSKAKSTRAGRKPEGRILESRPAPREEVDPIDAAQATPLASEPDEIEPDEIEPVEHVPEEAPARRARRSSVRASPLPEPAQEPLRPAPVSGPLHPERPASPAAKPQTLRASKLSPSVAQRRARMKGLNLEDRWKWNLID